jgi:hypothetical protein
LYPPGGSLFKPYNLWNHGSNDFAHMVSSLVSAYDACMIKLFRKKYLAFTAGYAVKSKEAKEKVFQMFLKAADAIPHLRAHLVNYNFLEEIEKLPFPII